jgi:hypothetical protein
MKPQTFEHIVNDPAILGGKPVMKDTRISGSQESAHRDNRPAPSHRISRSYSLWLPIQNHSNPSGISTARAL